jgi:predicted transcriptional regulator
MAASRLFRLRVALDGRPATSPVVSAVDTVERRSYSENMEVSFKPDLLAKVNRIAAENNSGPEEYVHQLVEHYVDHDAWFREQVKNGLDQLDRGEFLTHEQVGSRIEQMFRS